MQKQRLTSSVNALSVLPVSGTYVHSIRTGYSGTRSLHTLSVKTVIQLSGVAECNKLISFRLRQRHTCHYGHAIINIFHYAIVQVTPVTQGLFIGKTHGHTGLNHYFLYNPVNRRQHAFCCPGVGPDETARTQLDATKIPDNNHQYIAHVFMLNYAEDGFSGGSGRLA